MNAEKVYSLSCDILRALIALWDGDVDAEKWFNQITADPETYAKESIPGIAEAAQLLHMAKVDMASKKTSPSYVKGVTKVYKSACGNSREAYHGAWYDKQNRQCFCDNYRVIRLTEHVSSIPDAPYQNIDRIDTDRLFEPCLSYEHSFKLPTLKEVRDYIALDKANHKGKKGYRPPLKYDLGEGLPAVNAAYLYDMLNIFDGCTEAKWDGKLTSFLYFSGSRGDGILLPIRKTA